MKVKNCWLVEVRMENTRESVAEARYTTIDEVGGRIEDAQRIAQDYLNRRVDRFGSRLQWVEGTNGTRSAYYAQHPAATFRITG